MDAMKGRQREVIMMKINKPSNSGFINPYQKTQNKTQVSKAAQAKRKDQVQISDQAKAMLGNKVNTDPVHQQKVKELKQQVQNGEYQVDSRKVAEKMYQFWFGED
ncbi:flagellar biosynthesis anti-sigma factor FlgM [Bacillus horti]|uniref:Negative regulator of flagellin synthesis n=1 Tax=Caldalkalibacillus horti TaxID=77523 RepID=A0ABT9VZC5_9BACI|nr:flagellar biosynthesis anti-sigma factor FlgM [Bacillus horti]MDQ0166345.1 negative regulator of flagellin synthesis FlgM [Bacillus horti]